MITANISCKWENFRMWYNGFTFSDGLILVQTNNWIVPQKGFLLIENDKLHNFQSDNENIFASNNSKYYSWLEAQVSHKRKKVIIDLNFPSGIRGMRWSNFGPTLNTRIYIETSFLFTSVGYVCSSIINISYKVYICLSQIFHPTKSFFGTETWIPKMEQIHLFPFSLKPIGQGFSIIWNCPFIWSRLTFVRTQ